MLWNFNKYIVVTLDINCTWDVQSISYLGVYFEIGFGLQFKINLLRGFSSHAFLRY